MKHLFTSLAYLCCLTLVWGQAVQPAKTPATVTPGKATSAETGTTPKATEKGENPESITEEDVNAATANASMTPEASVEQDYSNTPKKDNLRMSNSISFGKFAGGGNSIISWKGNFDYYLHDMLSVSGTATIPFNSSLGLKPYFLGLGGNIHWYQLGPVDFFSGATGGFTIVTGQDLPTKGIPTVDLEAGIGLYGDFFCLIGEVSWRLNQYFAGGTEYDMNSLLFHVGIGFKL